MKEEVYMSGKIYKHNPVVRGHFIDNDKGQLSLLNEFEIDLLNYLYFKTQQNLFNFSNIDDIPISDMCCHMRYSEIKKAFNISSKDYKNRIRIGFENIMSQKLVLKNYKHPDSNTVYKEYTIPMLTGFGKEVNYDADAISVEIHPVLTAAIVAKNELGKPINFTLVNIQDTRRLKSKIAKRLYEHLLSMKQIRKDFSMDFEALCKLFGNRPERGITTQTQNVKRCYYDVKEMIPFEYKYNKATKKIDFKIM